MEDEICHDDLRTNKKRNYLHYIQRPDFHIYVLLAVSFLLTVIFYIAFLSKATTLSSEMNKISKSMRSSLAVDDLDDKLFPCGPNYPQWEYFNGKCYYFSLDTVPWGMAHDRCRNSRAQLVVINDMAEQNFLQARARNARHWIGLTDIDVEGEWKWVDGSSYRNGFRYWKRGEPNNDRANEHCAHLWGNGEWNDVFCTFLCYYICEKPMRRIF
ncbi:PREDICTED: hepatic lectin-like [Thamnophis sirtalis]|uniref:Hepatic lectin-like n=1 Tax=Thamnophis sirtalis TaxID=35019 RepID=A0A6I9XZK6_9SAUR|nr:PREDICTED: hepatic lectin-like [Thamnophis sirtalis]XP_032066432.1 hepatic lectin-like [Thamnophis elegans]